MKKHLKLISTVLLAVLFFSCTPTKKESVVINFLPVRTDTTYGFINPQGKSIINPQFRNAGIFRNGVSLIQVLGTKPMWGFIKEDGKFAIKTIYKEATVFSEEVAWVVTENEAPEAINEKGDSLFSMKTAKTVRIFKDGLAAFSVMADSVNVKWGFVDKKGIIKIQPQFPSAGNFSDGKCAVMNSAGEWGYIDPEGKLIIGYQFSNAKEFITGKAIVQSGKEWGVVNVKGKFIINPLFSEMKMDNDQYIIKQNNKWGWCNRNGDIIISPQFNDASSFNGNELAPVKIGDKFGFINKKGKLKIDAQFDSALPFNGKIAWVMSNGKGGFIDGNAKYIIQPQYLAVSEDLKAYLLTGTSSFESVTTDYFNLESITDRLKTDITENAVAGLNINTSMAQIFKIYKKKDVDFTKNGTEHKIISAERISNDATLDFFILGTPWTETYNGKLGFSYTLKPNYKHTGFTYRINLSAKGIGKELLVLKSLETALKGYVKDEKYSNENVLILKSKYQLIIGLTQKGMIIIAIYPLTPENLQMVDLNYGDGTKSDSTIVDVDTIAHKK